MRAALAHVQFEAIHPFLDGNGRVGRLLITLVSSHAGVLREPLLYLSASALVENDPILLAKSDPPPAAPPALDDAENTEVAGRGGTTAVAQNKQAWADHFRQAAKLSVYFKRYRAAYYELLDRVRRDGDWEAWLSFFLEGVKQTAENAVSTAQGLAELFSADQARVESSRRRAGSALRVLEALKRRPLSPMPQVCRATGLSFPAASSGMGLLVEMEIARELTGKRRNRLFVYNRYLAMLNEGTEAS